MTPTTRRTVLKAGALAAGAIATPQALRARSRGGAPLSNKVTVVLFLRGGADALQLFAPTGESDYATLRPTIGLGAPGSGADVEGLAMDPTFSMHPALAHLHAAYTASNSACAIVHACGYQPANRSHFASMSLYERALAGLTSGGWINRHLQATATAGDAPVRALALRSSLPESMWGAYPCFAVASTAELAYAGAPDQRAWLQKLAMARLEEQSSSALALAGESQRDTFALLDRFSALDPAAYVPQNGAVYPASSLGSALREAAEVVKADLGVEFVAIDAGGWDHHSGLPGNIQDNAYGLDQALEAFFVDLGILQDDVLVVAMSEFGRTARENGSFGTDHGMGGSMVLRGASVVGGHVHGYWPTVAPAALTDGNFLTPSNDFRDVLQEVLEAHMGGTDPAFVFPAHVHTPIGAF